MTNTEASVPHSGEPEALKEALQHGVEAGEESFKTAEAKEIEAGATTEASEDDDEEESCGFCKYMKAGGCRTEFDDWSKCVDKDRKEGVDFVTDCHAQTLALQNCMVEHKEYYADVLQEGSSAAKPGGGGSESKDAESAAEASTTESAEPATGGPVTTEQEENLVEASGGDAGEASQAEEASGEAVEESAEAEPEKKVAASDVHSVSYDPRFPSVNQARNCYTRYNEYHKCVAEKGEDEPTCSFYARAYRTICPTEWVDRWNEQKENGSWPGRY